MITIRPEALHDQAAIHQVNELAFGSPAEADLVDALRAEADPFLSLVAVRDGKVVGHISFTPVTIESEGTVSTAMGLAPMAVLPDFQNQGIGSDLVRRGLDECRLLGEEVVVVLGHPAFYDRFGFVPAASFGIRSEYSVPDEVFRIVELRPGALDGRRGLIRYHPAFGRM